MPCAHSFALIVFFQAKNKELEDLNVRLQTMVRENVPTTVSNELLDLCNRIHTPEHQEAQLASMTVEKDPSRMDFSLVQVLGLQSKNTSFVVTDPKLPSNPIVYASPGFVELTGYSLSEALGRDCKFLQGPATDPADVEVIRRGLREGKDTAVNILNYKKDGTPFSKLCVPFEPPASSCVC
jgi:hypothetical protein